MGNIWKHISPLNYIHNK